MTEQNDKDFMPMGMPPIMVAFEDMQQFLAQEERIKELESQLSTTTQELEDCQRKVAFFEALQAGDGVLLSENERLKEQLAGADEMVAAYEEMSAYTTGTETVWEGESPIAKFLKALQSYKGKDDDL